jgi:hypothetical protein
MEKSGKPGFFDEVSRRVVAGIICAIILGAASCFLPGVGDWLSGMWDVVCKWVKWFLVQHVAVPLWGLVLIPLAIPAMTIVFRWLRRRFRPTYESYTEDTFEGIRWRWKYSFGKVTNLNAHCPECGLHMGVKLLQPAEAFLVGSMVHEKPEQLAYICEDCDIERPMEGSDQYFHDLVKRRILKNIEYRK